MRERIPRVHGDRVVAIALLNRVDALRRFVERRVPARHLPPVALTPHRLTEAVGVLVQILERERLRADVPAAEGILLVATHRDDPVVFGDHRHPAHRLAEMTTSMMREGGHAREDSDLQAFLPDGLRAALHAGRRARGSLGRDSEVVDGVGPQRRVLMAPRRFVHVPRIVRRGAGIEARDSDRLGVLSVARTHGIRAHHGGPVQESARSAPTSLGRHRDRRRAGFGDRGLRLDSPGGTRRGRAGTCHRDAPRHGPSRARRSRNGVAMAAVDGAPRSADLRDGHRPERRGRVRAWTERNAEHAGGDPLGDGAHLRARVGAGDRDGVRSGRHAAHRDPRRISSARRCRRRALGGDGGRLRGELDPGVRLRPEQRQERRDGGRRRALHGDAALLGGDARARVHAPRPRSLDGLRGRCAGSGRRRGRGLRFE